MLKDLEIHVNSCAGVNVENNINAINELGILNVVGCGRILRQLKRSC